jgi:hypothetical protein
MKPNPMKVLTLLLLIVVQQVQAGIFEVEKKFQKTFTVNQATKLYLENSFGKVHVNTWNKNEFKVEVHIVVAKKSEKDAQELLDAIQIIDSEKKGDFAKVMTQMSQKNLNNKGADKISINYTVYAPESNYLEVKNKFGSVYIADRKGELNLYAQYGDVKIDQLMHTVNDIKVSFGNLHMQDMKGGNVNINYGELKAAKFENVDIKSSFSPVNLEEIGTSTVDVKHGDFKVAKAKSINGSLKFSSLRIGILSDELDIKAQHAGIIKIEEVISSQVQINIASSFSPIEIKIPANAQYDLDFQLKFADLRTSGLKPDYHYQVKEHTSSSYKGKIGEGGKGKIKVTSSYGDVKLIGG